MGHYTAGVAIYIAPSGHGRLLIPEVVRTGTMCGIGYCEPPRLEFGGPWYYGVLWQVFFSFFFLFGPAVGTLAQRIVTCELLPAMSPVHPYLSDFE